MDTVTLLPGVTEPGGYALIGFTGHQVMLAAGEDWGLEVGRLVSARELLYSVLI